MKKWMPSIVLCLLLLAILFTGGASAEVTGSGEELIRDLHVIDYSSMTMNESMVDLAHACNTDYGYQDLVNNVGNPNIIILYDRIDAIYEAFFATSADALQDGGSYIAGTITIDGGLLTVDQIFQAWTVYRMDHPAYYWIPDSIELITTEGTVTFNLDVYADYASGSTRQSLYSSLRSKISQFASYTSGSGSRYTYATGSLYKLAQIVEYASSASGDPEMSPWAHSIAGVIDGHNAVVCEGYAKFYQLLMNYFGVPNVYVVGRANGNTGDSGSVVHHAWNLVQMDDGQWYWTDPTWADCGIGFLNIPNSVNSQGMEIQTNITHSDDCPFYVEYTYHLIGDSFYSNHWPLTSQNTGLAYHYSLPSVSSSDYVLPASLGVAPAKGNLFLVLSEQWVWNDEFSFFVIKNDGIHRAVELIEYFSDADKNIPAQITYQGISYDVLCVDLSCAIERDTRTATIAEGVRYLVHSMRYEPQITESISIPSTVEWIDDPGIAYTCLENIFVSDNNPYIKDIDGVLYNKNGTILLRYPLAAQRESYTVPSSVKRIFGSAFNDDRNLVELNLPEGLTKIDTYAFQGMKSLVRLDIPSSVASLPGYIMRDSYIEEIHITAYTTFTYETFAGALGIRLFDIDEGNPSLIVYDGALYIQLEKGIELIMYPPRREADTVTVREDCVYIWPNAFNKTVHVGKVVIPDSCEVAPGAFFNSGVESLEISENNTSIKYSNGAIMSPDGTVLWVYLGGCRNKTFRVPDSVTEIADSAFCYNPYIESVDMGDQVLDIKQAAFYGCTALRHIRLSNSITWESAGEYIFEGCSSLEYLEIPSSAVVIPPHMCWECFNLRTVVIPSSVRVIMDSFTATGEFALTDIYYYGTEEEWNAISGSEYFNQFLDRIVIHFNYDGSEISTYDDFSWELSEDGTLTVTGSGPMKPFAHERAPWYGQRVNIKKVIIEDGLTSVSINSFDNCSNLTQVILPESVTRIETNAFSRCSSLKEISLPDGVTFIGINAFNSAGLTSVHLGPSVNSLDLDEFWDAEPFYGCWSIEEITVDPSNETYTSENGVLFNKEKTKLLCYPGQKPDSCYSVPEGVIQLGSHCFSCCDHLKHVVLPHSLSRIEYYVFYLSYSISTIYYPGTQEEWDQVEIGDSNDYLLSRLIMGEHEHRGELYNQIEPSCTDAGYSGDMICYLCGITLESGEAIPAGHNWEDVEYEWADDNSTVTARRVCTRDETHIETETVDVSSEETKPATCLEMGETTYTSSEFENEVFELQSKTVADIPMLEHDDPLEYVEAKEPTCTEPGNIEYWHCSKCDTCFSDADAETIITEPVTIPMIPHVLVAREKIEPTCAEEGSEAYWECENCHKLFSDEEAQNEIEAPIVIEKKAHTLTAHEKVDSTCTATGTEAYWSCDVCEKLFSDEKAQNEIETPVVIEKKEHTLTAHTKVDSTCAETGTEAYWSCDVCEKLFSDEEAQNEIEAPIVIGKKAHTLTAHTKVDSTCTATGTEAYWSCDVCGKLFSDEEAQNEIEAPIVIAKKAHTLTAHAKVDSTCTATGTEAYWSCDVCGKLFSDEEAQNEIEAPIVIGKKLHTLTAHAKVDSTCTATGTEAYWSCDVCGKRFSDEEAQNEIEAPIVIVKKAHTLTAHTKVESTCTATGTEAYWSCDVCEKLFSNEDAQNEIEAPVVIEKKAHTLTAHAKVDSTCTATGTEAYWSCDVCEKLFSDEEAQNEIEAPVVIGKKAHTLTTHAKVDSTCTATGIEAYWSCDVCEKLFSDEEAQNEIETPVVISKKAHTLTAHAKVDSTCTATGTEAYWECSTCRGLFSDEEGRIGIDEPVVISAKGHDWNEAVYEWSADNTSITATHTCKHDESHSETETVRVTSEIVSPGETTEGSVIFTSGEFTKEGFSVQTKEFVIPALGNMSVLRLPGMLDAIEEDAFSGLACQAVIIPDGCTSIGENAFAGCTNLLYVRIPSSVTGWPSSAFTGCNENLVIDWAGE